MILLLSDLREKACCASSSEISSVTGRTTVCAGFPLHVGAVQLPALVEKRAGDPDTLLPVA